MSEIAAAVLLTIGVLGFAFTSIGLLVSRDVFDQIHYLAPGSLIGSISISGAVLLHGGFSQAGAKSVLIALLLVLSNPVLSHATARAHRIRRKQQLPPTREENIRVSDRNE
jgi:multicomponent Na+:H+ antiporter subunit G